MDIVKRIEKAKSVWHILFDLSVEDLERVISYAADKYHNTADVVLTDQEYDVLVDRLRILSPKSKALSVGALVENGKVELPYWMGSMNKIKGQGREITSWFKTFHGPYVVSDKLDGISCLLVKVDDEVHMYTRGDGKVGKDITHLIKYVNIGTDLKQLDFDLAVRGELVMSKKNFSKYADEMSNARNTVSGVVNSKPEKVNRRMAKDIDLVTYEVIDPTIVPKTQMKTLDEWGLNVVYYDIYRDINVDILQALFEKRRKKSPYEVDGIIVTDGNRHHRNKGGNPEYSFAYKGLTETANVTVKKVIWEESKDGVIVPRIQFDPVRLSQANLEFTAGFNARFIEDNGIGCGSVIELIRSGDVIPHIINIQTKVKPQFPKDMEYHWDKNHVNIVLDNPETNNTVLIKRLTKFVTDIGVENLSIGMITRLVDAGFNTVIKIVSLTQADLLSVDGFQDRLAKKIHGNLQSALAKMDLLTLMKASNLFGRGFGERKLKKILRGFPDIVDEYIPARRARWEIKINALEGFDDITTNSFLDALPDFQKFYQRISRLINVTEFQDKVDTDGQFAGMKIVFTGFREKNWKEIIESQGGQVSASVSKNTSLVVYQEGQESNSKYIKAVQLGLDTITRNKFAKKYF